MQQHIRPSVLGKTRNNDLNTGERDLDLTQIAVLSGFIATLIIILVTVTRQRRFEPKDF